MKTIAFLSIATVLLACAPADGTDATSSAQNVTEAPPATPPPPTMADNLHWYRNSAEMRALYLQGFRLAAANVDAALAADGAPAKGEWAIVTDCDETLLDNSGYQKSRGAQGFSPDSWSAWVQSKQSVPTPGSVAYIKHVRAVGGHVFVVTNAAQADCPTVQAHLGELGFDVDALLCQTDTSDKNARFDKVVSGNAVAGIGAQKVLQYTGDSIGDFPKLTQAARDDLSQLADVGSKYVVFPNPIYGSWTANPRN